MARTILVLALCVLPAIVLAARPARNPYEVEGRVFCDTCLAGFETSKTTYIAGAKVRLDCRTRKSMDLVYSKEEVTDSTGTYRIHVDEDRHDDICDVKVISSPQLDCMKPSSGRDRSRVALTSNNGIVSQKRFANSIGFEKQEAMSGCFELLRQYQEYED